MDLLALRTRFEPHLWDFLLRKQAVVQGMVDDPALKAWLAEPHRLLSAGGKRIRPLLCLLGYAAAGGPETDEAPMPAAVALELFHAFALIHDDIMDRGEDRHGVPTAHRSIAAALQAQGRRGDLPHVGVSQAIIVGDLLFSWAIEAFQGTQALPDRAQAASRAFFAMSDEVMVGQMLDIDLTTRVRSSFAEIDRKMQLKTAGYTFIKPLQIGLALAGADGRLMEFAQAFGASLGAAFQIQDDLLDAFGATLQTGKTALSDLRDHQHSWLTQWVLERGSAADRAVLAAEWGNAALGEAAAAAVRGAFVRSGAAQAALAACRERLAQAEACCAAAALPDAVRPAFAELIAKAVPQAGLDRLEALLVPAYARA